MYGGGILYSGLSLNPPWYDVSYEKYSGDHDNYRSDNNSYIIMSGWVDFYTEAHNGKEIICNSIRHCVDKSPSTLFWEVYKVGSRD